MASLAVWLGICDYLVDLYDNVGWGASALAANTVLRSSFAGCFPLFGNGTSVVLDNTDVSDV